MLASEPPMARATTLPQKLRAYFRSRINERTKAGVQSQEIAKRSGVSKGWVSDINKPGGFSLINLEKLSRYFGIDPADAVREAETMAAGAPVDAAPERTRAMSQAKVLNIPDGVVQRVLALPPDVAHAEVDWIGIAKNMMQASEPPPPADVPSAASAHAAEARLSAGMEASMKRRAKRAAKKGAAG